MGSPNPANRFSLTIDGNIDLGSWSSVSGLDVDSGLDPGGRAFVPGTPQPGPAKYSDIQLTRAACADSVKVQAWIKSCSTSNSSQGRTGLITLWGSDPTTKINTWNLIEVIPLKWAVEKIDASTSKVAVETLTLAHEGFLHDEMQS